MPLHQTKIIKKQGGRHTIKKHFLFRFQKPENDGRPAQRRDFDRQIAKGNRNADRGFL